MNQNEPEIEGNKPVDAPLTLDWNRWHSGGGCMIWSLELPDGRSVHIGSDLLVLSSLAAKRIGGGCQFGSPPPRCRSAEQRPEGTAPDIHR